MLRYHYQEDLGMRLSCFGREKKMADTSLVSRVRTTAELGKIIAKNMAKTARRQLGGQHLLFGE